MPRHCHWRMLSSISESKEASGYSAGFRRGALIKSRANALYADLRKACNLLPTCRSLSRKMTHNTRSFTVYFPAASAPSAMIPLDGAHPLHGNAK
jgi:hypothetical protein